jgi:hypothetical protein
MFSFIFNFVENLLHITLFILLIPRFFFTIPSGGENMAVVAIHGLIYSFGFMLLHIMFSAKRIVKCAKSMME